MRREELEELATGRLEKHKNDALLTIHESLRPVTVTECEDCGEDIGEKRRAALPSAIRCIDCQEKHERDHRR